MKAFKKIVQMLTQSNRMSLCSALYKFLLYAAPLWATPGITRAQLYVPQVVTKDGEVIGIGKFDATTGAVIKSDLLGAYDGVFGVSALAVSGNVIYLPGTDGGVETFNATTGLKINLNFVLAGGLQQVHGLALSGRTLIVLGVAGTGADILEYDATTGAPINLNYITTPADPRALAVSSNTLFVSLDTPIFGVGTYNIATGTAINSSLISGLATYPFAIAVSGNVIYAATNSGVSSGTVGAYDATTGAAINANLLTLPTDWVVKSLAVSGGTLFVGRDSFLDNHNLDSVATYNALTGALINPNFVLGKVGSLVEPLTLAVVSGTSTNPSTISLGNVAPQWQIAGLGDFKGNGNADLVWQNTSTGQRAIWFFVDGVRSSALNLPTVAPQWRIAGSGDFDGDGDADLVWENTSTGQRSIWLLKNGVHSGSITLPTMPLTWRIAGAGDFDGDGNADLVWENASTGQRAIWLLKKGVPSGIINLPTVGVQWDIAGVGDFNNDGKADLVWENTVTGQRAIWFMNDGVLTSTINLPTTALAWHIAGAGDFNNDGFADIVWENTDTGQRAIWLLKNGVLSGSIALPAVSEAPSDPAHILDTPKR
jgi:hypothetical protein